jgi:hypothetical protein
MASTKTKIKFLKNFQQIFYLMAVPVPISLSREFLSFPGISYHFGVCHSSPMPI